MASWDSAQLPNAPAAPGYAAPLLDLSGIGNLPETYAKGQILNNQLQQLNAFKNGVPIDPATGQPDIKAIAQTMAQIGGVHGAMQAIPILQRQQFLNAYSNQQPPSEEGEPQSTEPERRQSVSVTPYGLPVQQPVQQATEGMVSAVPETGPNAGRNIAPEVNADATRVAQAQPSAERPSTLPPGVSEATAKNLDKTARWYANRANIAESQLGKGAGAGDLKLSEQYAQRAAKIREQIAAHGPTSLERQKQEGLQKIQMDRGEKLNQAYQGGATQYLESQKPYNDLARAILSEPGMSSGLGGDWKLVFNRAKDLVGMDNAAALQEALQKVTASSVLAQINNQRIELGEAGQTSSRIFSSQVDQVTKASPSLGTTLGGNRYLVNVSDRMGEFRIRLAEQAQQYRENHGYLDSGWDKHLGEYLKKNPVFTQAERSNPKLLMSPTMPAKLLNEKGVPRDPAEARKWGIALGLNKGDSIILPDGTYKHWNQ